MGLAFALEVQHSKRFIRYQAMTAIWSLVAERCLHTKIPLAKRFDYLAVSALMLVGSSAKSLMND